MFYSCSVVTYDINNSIRRPVVVLSGLVLSFLSLSRTLAMDFEKICTYLLKNRILLCSFILLSLLSCCQILFACLFSFRRQALCRLCRASSSLANSFAAMTRVILCPRRLCLAQTSLAMFMTRSRPSTPIATFDNSVTTSTGTARPGRRASFSSWPRGCGDRRRRYIFSRQRKWRWCSPSSSCVTNHY